MAEAIGNRLLAVALLDLARSREGQVFGTAAELHLALAERFPREVGGDAFPTSPAHLDHLLRGMAGRAVPGVPVEIDALARTAGWIIRTASAGDCRTAVAGWRHPVRVFRPMPRPDAPRPSAIPRPAEAKPPREPSAGSPSGPAKASSPPPPTRFGAETRFPFAGLLW